jgi:hypothetical protein
VVEGEAARSRSTPEDVAEVEASVRGCYPPYYAGALGFNDLDRASLRVPQQNLFPLS